MTKLFLVISTVAIILSLLAVLYNNNKYVTYGVDVINVCEGGTTTLAPRQIEKIMIKKTDESKFIEESKREKKCFWKI
jgi:intracellular septation protein A